MYLRQVQYFFVSIWQEAAVLKIYLCSRVTIIMPYTILIPLNESMTDQYTAFSWSAYHQFNCIEYQMRYTSNQSYKPKHFCRFCFVFRISVYIFRILILVLITGKYLLIFLYFTISFQFLTILTGLENRYPITVSTFKSQVKFSIIAYLYFTFACQFRFMILNTF